MAAVPVTAPGSLREEEGEAKRSSVYNLLN